MDHPKTESELVIVHRMLSSVLGDMSFKLVRRAVAPSTIAIWRTEIRKAEEILQDVERKLHATTKSRSS